MKKNIVDQSTSEKIFAFIVEIWTDYVNKNIESYIEKFSHEKPVSTIGTGEDEIAFDLKMIRTFILRDANQMGNPSFDLEILKINNLRSIYWILYKVNLTLHSESGEIILPLTVTTILEEIDDYWKVRHNHSSLPFIGQDEGQAFPHPEEFEKTLAKWINLLKMDKYLDKSLNRSSIISYLDKVRLLIDDSEITN